MQIHQLYDCIPGTPTSSDYMYVVFLLMPTLVDPTTGFGCASRFRRRRKSRLSLPATVQGSLSCVPPWLFRVVLTLSIAWKLAGCDKCVHSDRRTLYRAAYFTPLQRHLRSRARHAHLPLRKTVSQLVYVEKSSAKSSE